MAALLCGCATKGPGYMGPNSGIYSPEVGDIVMPASWYHNTLLGDAASFHNHATGGSLVLRPKLLIFAIPEPQTDRKIIVVRAPVDAVTYVTSKKHGLARIVRLQVDGSFQSFLFSGSASDGSSKDVFAEKVLAAFTG